MLLHMPVIELSDATYRRLLARVQSFEDTAEQVVLRLLEGTEEGTPPSEQARPRHRASPGSILPEREYWLPMLAAIDEAGGWLPANDAIEAVGERLKDQLTEQDLAPQKLGEVRWRNRARFARLRMKEQGLLSARISPRDLADHGRGLWSTCAVRSQLRLNSTLCVQSAYHSSYG